VHYVRRNETSFDIGQSGFAHFLCADDVSFSLYRATYFAPRLTFSTCERRFIIHISFLDSGERSMLLTWSDYKNT
jgi:hypothetical protein